MKTRILIKWTALLAIGAFLATPLPTLKKAGRVAWKVHGVKRVKNDLIVR